MLSVWLPLCNVAIAPCITLRILAYSTWNALFTDPTRQAAAFLYILNTPQPAVHTINATLRDTKQSLLLRQPNVWDTIVFNTHQHTSLIISVAYL